MMQQVIGCIKFIKKKMEAKKMEGYCVKCKAKREIVGATPSFNKRGSAVVFGTCPVCGTKIYRIGRTELHDGMEAPKK